MKIDFHAHITPPDIITDWEKYAEKEPYFALLNKNAALKAGVMPHGTGFASAQDAAAVFGKEGSSFDKAVIFGFAFKDAGLCRYVNDYVIESVKKYPQLFTGFCVVPPPRKKGEAAKEIERCFSAGLKGAGELFPEGQGFDLEDKNSTAEIAGACRELSIPLLLHANEPVGHYYAGKTGVTLRQIESFVAGNPGLDIVLAHWGGGIFLYETMKEIKKSFANVYYDTAASPFLYDERVYSAAKALGLCKKILFGSDFPLLPHSRYLTDLDKSGLSEEEKNMILGGNALNLMKGTSKNY